MQISANLFKAIQGFLLMGVPFILFFYLNNTVPFEFALLALLTLIGALLFIKVEMIMFLSVHGIDSVHDHLTHIEGMLGATDRPAPKARGKQVALEAIDALTALKEELKRKATEEQE